MKFQLDEPQGGNSISRHDAQGVWVNGQPHTASVLVPWKGAVAPWAPSRFEELQPADFEAIKALNPELVVFGSGAKLRFPSPALWRGLVEARIGFEVMDLAAACRTYNVLASEGRNVLAALLIVANALYTDLVKPLTAGTQIGPSAAGFLVIGLGLPIYYFFSRKG